MLKDNESICSNCDKKVNDDTETKWDLHADPFCKKCFEKLPLSELAENDRERRKEPIEYLRNQLTSEGWDFSLIEQFIGDHYENLNSVEQNLKKFRDWATD